MDYYRLFAWAAITLSLNEEAVKHSVMDNSNLDKVRELRDLTTEVDALVTRDDGRFNVQILDKICSVLGLSNVKIEVDELLQRVGVCVNKLLGNHLISSTTHYAIGAGKLLTRNDVDLA